MASKKNSFDKYIDQVGEYFAKLPELPKGGRDFVITVLPWVALIFGVLGLIGSLASFGVFSYLSPAMWGMGGNYLGGVVIMPILGIISSVLLLMAFPKLRKSQEKGWKYAYYSEVVALVSNIVVFSLVGILLTLLGFYFLYQVRSHYLK